MVQDYKWHHHVVWALLRLYDIDDVSRIWWTASWTPCVLGRKQRLRVCCFSCDLPPQNKINLDVGYTSLSVESLLLLLDKVFLTQTNQKSR